MKRVINFMGVRHVAFALTVVLTVASLASLMVKGLNFGLDFTGGTLIELGYERPVELEQVRGQLERSGFGDAVVQSFGATTDVLVRMPGDDPQLGERVADALRSADSANPVSVKRVEFVGPAVGEELR
ncbi:MAG: protein translocase subunit SecF, partial [Planctomycetaceae bacterium]|nr:protein translocase subunit SecF [Planctomycetaceae bacterium]